MNRSLLLLILSVTVGLVASQESAYKGADFSAVNVAGDPVDCIVLAQRAILESQRKYQAHQTARIQDLEEQANVFCILRFAATYNIREISKKTNGLERIIHEMSPRLQHLERRVHEMSSRLQCCETDIVDIVNILRIHKGSIRKADEARMQENVVAVKKMHEFAEQVANLEQIVGVLQQKVDGLQDQNDTLQQQLDALRQTSENVADAHDAVRNDDACATRPPSRVPTPSLFIELPSPDRTSPDRTSNDRTSNDSLDSVVLNHSTQHSNRNFW